MFEDAVQGGDDVVERVGPHLGGAVLAAVEGAAEVVEAFISAGFLADKRVGVEPDERTLVVEIDAPAAARPFVAGTVQMRGRGGRVFQWPPSPTVLVFRPVGD